VSEVLEGLKARLEVAQRDLARLSRCPNEELSGRLTAPDGATGERWEAGQVWAHLAEIVTYWVSEGRKVLAGSPDNDPVPFGRTKADEQRVAAIEASRHADPAMLYAQLDRQLGPLRGFLEDVDTTPGGWQRLGRHSTLGEMDLRQIVEEFLIGHIEEHREQLEQLKGDLAR
jgi:hypothetical protein